VAAALGSDGEIDVAELTKHLPARLMGEWFGTPGPDPDTLIGWTMPMFQDIFYNITRDATIHAAAMAAAGPLREYLAGALAERKSSGAVKHDVLGRLIALQGDPATAFTDFEIATNLIGLIVGFIPTVTTAVTFGFDELLKRPEAFAAARQAALADDIDTVRAYMWEAMRLAPLAPGLPRIALVDTVLAADTEHAKHISADAVVFAATQSAMLDGDAIEHPKEFRIGRPADSYLFFGAGMHQCFGRFANAMQVPMIARALLRVPNLTRAEGEVGRLQTSGPYPRSLVLTGG
jgi:cytochrome P450